MVKKALLLNTKSLSKYANEHEYLIGSTNGTVVGYSDGMVTVLIE